MSSLLEKELEGKIMQSVSSLPEFTREIFEMSRHDGLKYEEIAARKNITIDIVKYHIRLSLNQLRHDLRDYLPFWLTLFLLCKKIIFSPVFFSFVISIEEEHYGYTNYRSGYWDDLIIDRLSGNLSADDRARLERWLDESEEHRQYYSQMKELWDSSEVANPHF